MVSGTVDRVGADFVEMTEHGAREPRRRGEVSAVRTIPFGALALIRQPAHRPALVGVVGVVGVAGHGRVVLGLAELVGADELAGLVVHPGDVALELTGLDPPLAAPADLDRRQVAAPDQCVDLRGGDVQRLGDVGELEEARAGAGEGEAEVVMHVSMTAVGPVA